MSLSELRNLGQLGQLVSLFGKKTQTMGKYGKTYENHRETQESMEIHDLVQVDSWKTYRVFLILQLAILIRVKDTSWLVVEPTPLKNMISSIGMMKFPT